MIYGLIRHDGLVTWMSEEVYQWHKGTNYKQYRAVIKLKK